MPWPVNSTRDFSGVVVKGGGNLNAPKTSHFPWNPPNFRADSASAHTRQCDNHGSSLNSTCHSRTPPAPNQESLVPLWHSPTTSRFITCWPRALRSMLFPRPPSVWLWDPWHTSLVLQLATAISFFDSELLSAHSSSDSGPCQFVGYSYLSVVWEGDVIGTWWYPVENLQATACSIRQACHRQLHYITKLPYVIKNYKNTIPIEDPLHVKYTSSGVRKHTESSRPDSSSSGRQRNLFFHCKIV